MAIHQGNPKVLVTGGTGYIGSHTVVELIDNGYEVLIIDDLSNSNEIIIEQIEKITGIRPRLFCFDLKDYDLLETFAKSQPDIVGIIHFAAYKAVNESVLYPLKYYRNNIRTLLNLLDCFGDRNINFVFSSSCTVYGQPDVLPVTEDTPFKPAESPYGRTKQMGEDILKDFTKINRHFNAVSLRYFNPVGAHSSALIGELPNGIPQNLVPYITQTAVGKREKLIVFGNDYPTSDGSCIRDYIHVTDLAKAHVSALSHLGAENNTSNYEYYNIGTGKGTSVLELINTFETITQQKLNYVIGNRRDGDVVQIWASVRLANEQLNWKASLSLEDMMLSAWKWELYLKNHTF